MRLSSLCPSPPRDTSRPWARNRRMLSRFGLLGILELARLTLTPLGAMAQDTRAELIVHGGTIYTLAEDRPSAVEALAIAEGAVLAAGTREQIETLRGPATRELDLEGAFAMPGLSDAHAHLISLGKFLAQANLIGSHSVAECIERASAYERELSPGQWLVGRGWDQNDWEVELYPDRRLLDEAFGERPVILRRVDGHASWVNSAALARAGIDAGTADPPGGEILHDARGEPTGILIDEAEELVKKIVPPPDEAGWDRIVDAAVENAAREGLSCVHEMGVTLEQLAAFRRAEADGRLKIRVVLYLGGDEVLREFDEGPHRPGPEALLRIEGVKLYADGALGSRGAALLEDYSDRPGHRGLLINTPEQLRSTAARAFARRFGVAIHAIGDRGNRVALDAIEQGYRYASDQGPPLPPLAALRPRVEHAQILASADIPRFAALGVIPSMQPTHCTSDMPWAPQRLGEARIEGAYVWRTLRNTGCILPLGSDFPVEAVTPRLGLYAARTRQDLQGQPSEGWAPSQRLDALEALLGFTVWAAEAVGVPQWGRLSPGSRADFTILDRDPLDPQPAALRDARVIATYVEARAVWRREPEKSSR